MAFGSHNCRSPFKSRIAVPQLNQGSFLDHMEDTDEPKQSKALIERINAMYVYLMYLSGSDCV